MIKVKTFQQLKKGDIVSFVNRDEGAIYIVLSFKKDNNDRIIFINFRRISGFFDGMVDGKRTMNIEEVGNCLFQIKTKKDIRDIVSQGIYSAKRDLERWKDMARRTKGDINGYKKTLKEFK